MERQGSVAPVRKKSLIHVWWKGDGRREAKTIIAARKSCSADHIKLGIRKASGKCSLLFVVTSYSAKKRFLLFITTMFRFLVVAFWKDILLYLWDRCNYKKTVFLVSELPVNIPGWKASACSVCGQTSLGVFPLLLLLKYIMVREKDINWSCQTRVCGQCEFWIPLLLAEAHPVFIGAWGVTVSKPLPLNCCLFLKSEGWGWLLGAKAGMTRVGQHRSLNKNQSCSLVAPLAFGIPSETGKWPGGGDTTVWSCLC